MNAGDGPSANLRKRKTLTGDDKKLSDVSVKSEKTDILEDEEEKPTKEASSSDENSPKPKRKSKPIAKKSGSSAGNSDKRKLAKSDAESEEENNHAKSGAKSTKKKVKKEVKQEIKEEETEIIKTIKFSGEAPLDEKFIETVGPDYKIYKEDEVVFDCMLNQTNLQYNNNKYYLIQLIENKKSKNYLVWMRWGRVGKTGQFSVEHCGSDLAKAKNIFTKKFYDKTHNEWESKDLFEKVPGKYDLVLKDYDSSSNSGDAEVNTLVKVEQSAVKVESKLDRKLQDLIELICNVTEMENMLKEMKYDAKKAPLGKLGKSQIKAGYAALKEIEDLIKRKVTGRELVQANNDFYTRIPHDFGMRTPPMITTQAQVREKLKLLELLDDIEVAIKALNQKSEIDNPVDRHYEQLECVLKPIDHDDNIFKIIAEYVKVTHAPTHSNYKLKLVDVYEAQRKDEHARFVDHGNRMLLWHGSRITNWAGILSQGLRIAPEEAPVTGYMFGKGVYFSDCCSKSANYCYTSSNKNIGILSLSEVSLGVFNELKQADYNADKLPKGTHSTKGVGRSEPDKTQWKTLDDGCVVPCGKLKNCVKPSEASSYALLYNEYIVYNVDQIKLRYIVKVEFDYDDDDE